jgi:lipopolysaccharide export system permease protein
MFVENERLVNDPGNKDNGKTRMDVITATHGFLYHDADGVGRYLALFDGFRVEGTLGMDDYRLMRFVRNDIKLPDNENDDNDTAAKRSAPTGVLFRNPDDPVMRAEIHWRLAAPLSALVLTLLALPLSKSSPREPRYARLLVAVLAWWVFNTSLGLGRSWISQGKIAPIFGFWWVYLPTLGVAAWLIWSSQRIPRARVKPSTP